MSCHQQRVSSPQYAPLKPSAGTEWIKNLTLDRIRQFNSGHFGDAVGLATLTWDRCSTRGRRTKEGVCEVSGVCVLYHSRRI
ncbi:hypothetical protein B0H15DRAFT_866558 [Mycena belliarum]|uniref:Uncharacterized protein n=1 Tax=Mycena belliarum TaxID=1033014 RepID=A0AAD6TPK2_9AGAR|nr:hypothetical protein B0H15DRAFT_866558 [Mycena belliae]